MLEIRALTPEHARDLATFTCAGFREPESRIVQEMIRDHLPEAIRMGVASGVGLWSEDDLFGVTAWTVDLDQRVIRSCVLAVRVGQQRRGHGRRLKDHLLEVARISGARAVVSQVHEDNVSMLRLNRRAGAMIERDERDADYFNCVVPIRASAD
jgi:GNAT superfamily N-acetyltransferase